MDVYSAADDDRYEREIAVQSRKSKQKMSYLSKPFPFFLFSHSLDSLDASFFFLLLANVVMLFKGKWNAF